jgi:flagellar export protein FliJ
VTSRVRVAAVLHVRETQEGIAKAALSIANHNERLARQAVSQWEAEMAEWGRQAGTQDASSFRSWRHQLEASKVHLEHLRHRVEQCAQEAASALGEYHIAAQRVEVLNRLHERLLERERFAEAAAEQIAMDEAAVTLFMRSH